MSALHQAPSPRRQESGRHPQPVNQRAQDIVLLAKGHYKIPDGVRRAQAARRLISCHNLWDGRLVNWHDAAHVVVNDMVREGLLELGAHRLSDMLLSFGPRQIAGPDYSQDGGFSAVLIDRIMDLVAMTRLLADDGGTSILPMPDPQVQASLDSLQPETVHGDVRAGLSYNSVSPDRNAIRSLVAKGYISSSIANDALNHAHGFQSREIPPAPAIGAEPMVVHYDLTAKCGFVQVQWPNGETLDYYRK